jgi:sarcosine oxidase delta subunit
MDAAMQGMAQGAGQARLREKGEGEVEEDWWDPQGQNGYFTRRFDTVSSEVGRNGIHVNEF